MSKRYSDELKTEVVKAILDDYRTHEDVEQVFGVPKGTYSTWTAEARRERRRQAELTRKEAARAAQAPVEAELRRANAALVEKLDFVQEENKILTEAMSSIQGIVIAAHNALN